AAGMGITAEQAGVLADKAGLIPRNVQMIVSTPGSDTTKQELALIKGLVDRVPPGKDIHMQTISADAERKLEDLGFTVTHMPDGTVVIKGNTQPAQQALDAFLAAPATKTVTVVYSGKSVGIGSAINHDGNVLQAAAYAGGGVHRLTPMRGGVAAIVPPNTWRIVGDRLRDDEAYIPINRSTRSQSLLQETAARMGFDLIRRFADGGIAARTQPLLAAVGAAGGVFEGQLVLDSGELLGVVRGEISRAEHRTGTSMARRRRP
ncbi:MAG TPA: hypothetical protein VGL02_19230, partial [Streptomyces sp.]